MELTIAEVICGDRTGLHCEGAFGTGAFIISEWVPMIYLFNVTYYTINGTFSCGFSITV